MALLDIRQRAGSLFLIVAFGHVLLISAQVNSRSGVPVLEVATFGVFSEAQRGLSAATSGVGHLWSNYINLRGARAENERLRRELGAAQVALQEQRALVDRARNFEQLLGLRDRSNLETIAADVIGGGATPEFRTVTVDKGTADHLQTDMAVIAPLGAVGRVIVPALRAAKVQLLVDRNAAAGALIERSRSQGVVVGTGGNRLLMEYVSEVADVMVGDLVTTSGIDGIYPKGYPIGIVESVERSGGAYRRITIKPAVDFSSLEEVLIVLTPSPAREAGSGE
jgi:rod shape-determining protein MreC